LVRVAKYHNIQTLSLFVYYFACVAIFVWRSIFNSTGSNYIHNILSGIVTYQEAEFVNADVPIYQSGSKMAQWN